MVNKKLHYFLALLFCIFVISACSNKNNAPLDESTIAMKEDLNVTNEFSDESNEIKQYSKSSDSEEHLYDNKDLYKNKDDYSIITMYLTVSKGNTGDSSKHTWSEVNTFSAYDYINAGDIERYKVEGLLQIDETGNGITENSFGYGETTPNVSVQVRGQTSSLAKQKNYKIRIKDGKGEFREQRTLNLNKHVNEAYRFTNKLCYDLANSIPELIAGRTQFVHLYVKDTTGTYNPSLNIDSDSGIVTKITTTANSSDFTDYGLYTMVEQVNRTYLKNHGFDENGQLYKVNFFQWAIQDELMLDQDDPLFDQSKFDTYLESKIDDNHKNLQQTITDINNYSIPIDHILEEHFDIENLIYYIAFNIMIGNNDVSVRNQFLYSPLNSKKFYFICWDMDGSMQRHFREHEEYIDGMSWDRGMTKYLDNTLINRMMKEQKYRDMLDAAVDDLYLHYVTPDIVKARSLKYAEVVKPFLLSMPDLMYSPIKSSDVYDELVSLSDKEIEDNYTIFKQSLLWPWPFYIDLPTIDKARNTITFSWGRSYNYGEDVTYDYILSSDYNFEEVLDEGHNLSTTTVTTRILPPGTYFLRVTSTGKSGYTSDCFDYYSIHHVGKQYGCYCFTVNDDGTVKQFEEEII